MIKMRITMAALAVALGFFVNIGETSEKTATTEKTEVVVEKQNTPNPQPDSTEPEQNKLAAAISRVIPGMGNTLGKNSNSVGCVLVKDPHKLHKYPPYVYSPKTSNKPDRRQKKNPRPVTYQPQEERSQPNRTTYRSPSRQNQSQRPINMPSRCNCPPQNMEEIKVVCCTQIPRSQQGCTVKDYDQKNMQTRPANMNPQERDSSRQEYKSKTEVKTEKVIEQPPKRIKGCKIIDEPHRQPFYSPEDKPRKQAIRH